MNNEQRVFWTDSRLKRITTALFIALTTALIIGYLSDTTAKGMLKRGDYPGFYVLGHLLHHGQADLLYDAETQRQIENTYWPSFDGNFYMSVYPPYDAVLFRPLAFVSPHISRILYELLIIASYLISIFLICRINPALKDKSHTVAIFSLFLAPLFYSVFAGQNTAFGMLLYALIIYLFQLPPNNFRYFMIGVAAGLWCFKPQFGLITCGLLFLTLEPWVIFGMAITTFGYYMLGVSVHGLAWPEIWLKAIDQFAAQNWLSNHFTMASLVGGAKSFIYGDNTPTGTSAFVLFAWCLVVALLTFGATKFISYGIGKDQTKKITSLNKGLLLLGPILVLCSPQTLFYDLGFLLIPLLLVLSFKSDRSINIFIIVALILGPITFFKDAMPFSIFPPIAVAATLLIQSAVKRIPNNFQM